MVIVESCFENFSVRLFAEDYYEVLVTSSSFTNDEEGHSSVSQLLLVYIRAAQETSKCKRYVSSQCFRYMRRWGFGRFEFETSSLSCLRVCAWVLEYRGAELVLEEES
jgi:hypothetical protein